MVNVGIAPFYYPLTLNAKAVNADTGSLISSTSIPVPIQNQIDQHVFIYNFDMMVQTNTTVKFSAWLNSSHLLGNQAIVFAIQDASASGIIQLPPIFIEPCATLF
jgi:hypothetical protein